MNNYKTFYRKDTNSDNRIDARFKREEKENLEYIKNNLPEQCKNCSFLIVVDSSKHIVRCPYMIKDKCIMK